MAKPKILSEHDAWLVIAKMWDAAWTGAGDCTRAAGGCSGMCSTIKHLWYDGRISNDQKDDMLEKIRQHMHRQPQVPSYPFVFSRDAAGAKKRAAFCRERARVIRKAAKEKLARKRSRRAVGGGR